MICKKCPAKNKCRDYAYDPDSNKRNNQCCFGKPDRPLQEVCTECDVKEICKVCSGAGMDTMVVTEESRYIEEMNADGFVSFVGIPDNVMYIEEEGGEV